MLAGTQFVLLLARGFELAISNASHLDEITFFFGPVPFEASISSSSKSAYFFLLAKASCHEVAPGYAPGFGLASNAASEFLKSALFEGFAAAAGSAFLPAATGTDDFMSLVNIGFLAAFVSSYFFLFSAASFSSFSFLSIMAFSKGFDGFLGPALAASSFGLTALYLVVTVEVLFVVTGADLKVVSVVIFASSASFASFYFFSSALLASRSFFS